MNPSYTLINGELVQLCEYIENQLYFITLTSRRVPQSTSDIYFFTIDDELVYENYYSDFGPLNLGCLYKYCVKLNTKLKHFALSKKKIIHYTSSNPQKRANAAYLIASYAIIYLGMTPRQAFRPLMSDRGHSFRPFQDATIGASTYHICLQDCLDGIYRALQHGFFNFDDFDLQEYEWYEKMQHGDLNWIIPHKFVAFCGPSDESQNCYKPPEYYINYFHFNNVSTIIRLNRKAYDSESFTKAGFFHFDLFFADGSVPSQSLTNKFHEICETTSGAIAVHCKAGLGRTGSLIAAYMMKHYRMTARESIAWIRICRPGSVIGRQQAWLEENQGLLWRSGNMYRKRRHGDDNSLPYHRFGIYSIAVHKKLLQNISNLPRQSVSQPHHKSIDDSSRSRKPHRTANKHEKKSRTDRYCLYTRNNTSQPEGHDVRENLNKCCSCHPACDDMRHMQKKPKFTQGDCLNAIKILHSKDRKGRITKET